MKFSLIAAILFLCLGIGMRLWIHDGVEAIGQADNGVDAAGQTLVLFGVGIGLTVFSTFSFFISAGFFVLFLATVFFKMACRLARAVRGHKKESQ